MLWNMPSMMQARQFKDEPERRWVPDGRMHAAVRAGRHGRGVLPRAFSVLKISALSQIR
jgi:hypothetical protein